MTINEQGDHGEQIKPLRVFISSPNDVRPERLIAEGVVRRLGREFFYYLRVEPVMWEREPLVASQHFQENITPPRDTDIVIVILWSRLGVELPIDKFVGPLSGKPVTGTEWEFEDALKSARERKLPDLLLYRKKAPVTGSLEDEEVVRQQLAQKRLVEDFIKSWFIDQNAQSFTAAFREFADAATLEELLETHLRELMQKRLIEHGDVALPAGIHWHQGSPFRGLLSFELEHAPVFFGRTRARNELRELLTRQMQRGSAFVMVIGASGSGKSSLVKAGLVSDLKLQGMIGRVALVRHAIFRLSEGEGDLTAKLAAAILSPMALPELLALHYDRESLQALLRSAPAQLTIPIQQGLSAASHTAELTAIAEARLLIVVDQLEEMFTLEGVTPKDHETFVAALEGLATSGFVWVVATMRSDFFDKLEKLPSLLKLSAGEARYVLAPPTPSEIGQMIRLPAREAGLTFDFNADRGVSLEDVIREAAVKDAGALPLLSFLMDQLWQHRSAKGKLTFEAYRNLGGLEGALGRRAEEVFMAQSSEVQSALPALLRALVTIGEGANATASARAVRMSTFPEGTPARALIEAFLDPKARLLVADTDFEPAGGGIAQGGKEGSEDARPQANSSSSSPPPPQDANRGLESGRRQELGKALVRIAHEALLSHWQRAKDQIDADRRDLALAARLENAAKRWQPASNKDRDSLVLQSGLPLTEALDLARRWGAQLSAEVTEFIHQSRLVARRRLRRLMLGLTGAVVSLPILAGLVWTAMVWRGVEIVESTMEFVPIPAHCFNMGSRKDEFGRIGDQNGDFDHEALHNVCVKAFELEKFDVTQKQWRLVMVENPGPSRFKGDSNPVEMVSWNDARSFIWRMRVFGKHAYRLPSEAEWEYAARGGTTTIWFWGNKLEDGCAYADLRDQTYKSKHWDVDEAIIGCADGFDETAPVGSFKPNPFDLYDMIGNVFQWTEDCWGDYAEAPTDGSAAEPKAGNCDWRVIRGGSWTSRPGFTRSASRDIYRPVNRNDVVGFRLAR